MRGPRRAAVPGTRGCRPRSSTRCCAGTPRTCWPAGPRPVAAADLLPERALAGDAEARRILRQDVFGSLHRAGGELLETLDAFFAAGGVLESAARALFVHPNTVRYRLRRVSELTGLVPFSGRDAFALRVALAVGRLDPGASSAAQV